MNNLVRAFLLAILTLGGFWPVFTAEFLSYDDGLYVTDCVFVRQGLSWNNVCWALTTFDASNWHPLMWLSLMLDRDLYGLSPAGFHATNLAWHVVNTLLLFHLLIRIAPAWPWRAFVVALLFAVHPLHVESVAWVAERKDVLFTAFGLLALHAYVSYTRGSRRAYWWCVLFLVLSLMSKSMLVTFPFLLMLLDYWPIGRVAGTDIFTRRANGTALAAGVSPGNIDSGTTVASAMPLKLTWPQLVLEKWPMFVVILGVSFTALLAQSKAGAVSSLQTISLPVRMANAVLAYGLYLWDTLWPTGLSVIYRHPLGEISLIGVVVSFVMLFVTSVVLFQFRQLLPAAWVGWCWFLGTLVPVIGIVQVGLQQRADRYTYFPLIGLFWGVVWSVGEFVGQRAKYRTVICGVTTLALASLLAATHVQVGYWKNSQTLFEHALKVEPENAVAYHSLGFVREQQGDVETAIAFYRKAVEFEPTLTAALLLLSHALMETAKGPEMEFQRQEAIAILAVILNTHPRHPVACNLWGNTLRRYGRVDEAVKSLRVACEAQPHNVSIRGDLAIALYELGEFDEAHRQFREAQRLDPENATLLLNVGMIELRDGNVRKAAETIRKAVELSERADRLAPDRPHAKRFQASVRLTLGFIAMQQGKLSEAVREFEQSDRLEPRVLQLQVNFGEALLQLRQFERAQMCFLKALELHPKCVEAHFGLGRVYANTQQLGSAIEHLTTALKLKPDFQPAQEFLNSLKNSDK